MTGLILASASPRRRELLARLGLPFAVVHAAVTEDEAPGADPARLVAHNAALKAFRAAYRINPHMDGIVSTIRLLEKALDEGSSAE